LQPVICKEAGEVHLIDMDAVIGAVDLQAGLIECPIGAGDVEVAHDHAADARRFVGHEDAIGDAAAEHELAAAAEAAEGDEGLPDNNGRADAEVAVGDDDAAAGGRELGDQGVDDGGVVEDAVALAAVVGEQELAADLGEGREAGEEDEEWKEEVHGATC
jgi:hypothetical protein